MPKLVEWVIYAVVLAVCMGILRKWMSQLQDEIRAAVSESRCDERRKHICRKIEKVELETDDQWTAIDHHGHKGFSGDQNQVIRSAT